MWKIVAVLALAGLAVAGLAIATGHVADTSAAFQYADAANTPLMYAGIRG